MSFLSTSNTTQSQPIAERRANLIRQQIERTWGGILQAQQQGMATLWDLPEEVSPQDVLDHLGIDAGRVLNMYEELGKLILSLDPDNKYVIFTPEDKALKFHEDGRVTIS